MLLRPRLHSLLLLPLLLQLDLHLLLPLLLLPHLLLPLLLLPLLLLLLLLLLDPHPPPLPQRLPPLSRLLQMKRLTRLPRRLLLSPLRRHQPPPLLLLLQLMLHLLLLHLLL